MLHVAEGVRPIRVCFYVFFPAGGIGRYTNELLRTLSDSPDVSVEAVCTPDFQWKDAPEYSTWAGLRSISHPISAVRRFRFLKGQFVNPVRGIRHAIAGKADIIHFSNINHLSFPFWRKALEASGMRVAVSAHDIKRQKRILSREWEDRQLKAFYRFADALFVHSTYQAEELVAFAGVPDEKIHLVPHGPYAHRPSDADRDEVRAKLGVGADRQVALFFGQLRDEKNLDRFIEALRLSASKPHLVVAGTAGGRHRGVDYYRQHAQREGVDHLITFIPRYISDEEVGRLFAAADWVALPYSNAFSSQSGVLNVAVYYERPVLVSSSPVLWETVNACDIGVACSGDTAAEMAEGIDRICQRMRDGHPHRFQDYRDQYSWEENARRTIAVYKKLVGGAPSA